MTGTYVFQIRNSWGMRAKITNLGASLMELHIPDGRGETVDVVLGYPNLEDYRTNPCLFGSTVAPCCNRIRNGRFILNGKTWQLERNEGNHNLHSGSRSLCYQAWEPVGVSESGVILRYEKKHLEMGFPGCMEIQVTYSLTEERELQIIYQALSDEDTIFNPTNHSYFNLAGHNNGSVLEQMVWIRASHFSQTDSLLIPDGKEIPVADTPMDFTQAKAIGQDLKRDYLPLRWAGGYDHNYILDKEEGQLQLAASLCDPKSGRKMEVFTQLPGIQLYSGNQIPRGSAGKDGVSYQPYDGVCLETQYVPNAINLPMCLPPILKGGQAKELKTVYRFSW